MALVCEDGKEWYEVTHCYKPEGWIAENVMPVIYKTPVYYREMRASLSRFIRDYDAMHIIADWPEDITRFCDLLITAPGQCIDHPPLTFEVLPLRCKSEVPHNALYDARAIKIAYLSEKHHFRVKNEQFS